MLDNVSMMANLDNLNEYIQDSMQMALSTALGGVPVPPTLLQGMPVWEAGEGAEALLQRLLSGVGNPGNVTLEDMWPQLQDNVENLKTFLSNSDLPDQYTWKTAINYTNMLFKQLENYLEVGRLLASVSYNLKMSLERGLQGHWKAIMKQRPGAHVIVSCF